MRLIEDLPTFVTALGDVAILWKDAERLQKRIDELEKALERHKMPPLESGSAEMHSEGRMIL